MKEKDAKKLLSEFFKKTEIDPQQLPSLKPPIEFTKTNDYEIFLINRKPIFVKSNDDFFPTLASEKLLLNMPRAIVDMGAVPHICNGADVMAPGIVHFEGSFNEGDFVVIIDKRYRKPIAITIALYSTEQAKRLKNGKIFENKHYVGDRLWGTIKQLIQTK
jgi:PUA domain protein